MNAYKIWFLKKNQHLTSLFNFLLIKPFISKTSFPKSVGFKSGREASYSKYYNIQNLSYYYYKEKNFNLFLAVLSKYLMLQRYLQH